MRVSVGCGWRVGGVWDLQGSAACPHLRAGAGADERLLREDLRREEVGEEVDGHLSEVGVGVGVGVGGGVGVGVGVGGRVQG